MPTYNSKGLLQPEEDPLSGAVPGGSGAPQQGPVQSGLATGAPPVLAGGATGVQRMDYGGAIANAGKQYAFNPKWAAVDQQLQRQIANAAFDRTNKYNALNAENTRMTGEAGRMQGLATQALTDRMASQGQGWGGEKLNEQGRLEGDYQRYIDQLRRQYEGGINTAENEYGRMLGDVAGQRETNWQAQAAEEEAARVERERIAAEARARAQEAARQQALQQQYIDSINQQNAWAQQQAQQSARANGIGGGLAGALGGMFTGMDENTTIQQILGAMNGITDLDWLTRFYQIPGVPEELRVPVRKAIVAANTPGGQYYIPQPVGHNDQPYGFNQGGMAL